MADTKDVQNQQPKSESAYSESQAQTGKENPAQSSSEKKGEQRRQNQPSQQMPKKDVQGAGKKEEHRRTGKR